MTRRVEKMAAARRSREIPVGSRQWKVVPVVAKPLQWLVACVLVCAWLPLSGISAQETALTRGVVVEIRISGVPSQDVAEVSGTYQLADSGSIKLPNIGLVTAAGLKPSELARAIEQSYREAEIFSRPIVNVIVSGQNTGRRIHMGGRIKSPGSLAYYDGITLLEAILECGGYSDFAKKEAKIRRDGDIVRYRMKDIEKDPLQDPRLKPGDVVIVD